MFRCMIGMLQQVLIGGSQRNQTRLKIYPGIVLCPFLVTRKLRYIIETARS